MITDEKMIQRVWEKARATLDKSDAEWRKDQCGAWLHRQQYNNEHSGFGWKILNIKAGEPDVLENLQPFHWKILLILQIISHDVKLQRIEPAYPRLRVLICRVTPVHDFIEAGGLLHHFLGRHEIQTPSAFRCQQRVHIQARSRQTYE